MTSLGIVGAGKLGIVLAQLARRAGYTVYVSGSGVADKIALSVEVLTPGALATTTKELTERADIIILALPLSKFRDIPAEMFDGKLVIDAMNYWWEVDGPRTDIVPDTQSSSEAVQEYFVGARVVKALSHTSYHDLYDHARPKGEVGRKAIAVAASSTDDATNVIKLVDTLGFDPLLIGNLPTGVVLEPGHPAFGVSLPQSELHHLLEMR